MNLSGAADGPEGSQAVSCRGWEYSVVPAGTVPFPFTTGTPGVSSTPRHLKLGDKRAHLGKTERKLPTLGENFLLKYVYIFLTPNGERHLMVSRAQ